MTKDDNKKTMINQQAAVLDATGLNVTKISSHAFYSVYQLRSLTTH